MLVKFDAQKVFRTAAERKLSKPQLQDIVGFMVADIIDRLNPFDDDVEVDITERMAEGIVIKADIDSGAEAPARPEPDLSAWTSNGKTHEQMLKEKMAMHNGFKMPQNPPKRRGRPPRVKE